MLSQEQKDEVLRMYRSGIMVKNIALFLKLKIFDVKNFLYLSADVKRRKKNILMSEIKEVSELREQGLTVKQITEQTGFNPHRVQRIVKKYCKFRYNQKKNQINTQIMDKKLIDQIHNSGYKQDHLAKMIGVTSSYFSRCKSGDKKLSEEKMQKLREILVS